MPPRPDHHRLTRAALTRRCLLLGALLLTGACSTNPSGRDQSKVMAQALQRGYDAVEHVSVRRAEATWMLDGDPVSIRILAPATSSGLARRPLLIYLPGLGEEASAGSLWREAWAQAGCIVVSAQPEAIRRSITDLINPSADDILALARDAFAPSALARRASSVERLLAEVLRRANAGEALLSQIDPDRLIVAGFDLGAQTAMALAGERIATPEAATASRAPLAGLRGVIALSPHLDITRGAVRERFGTVQVPVLVLTGTEDSDPWGLINSGSIRRAVWSGLPAGDKVLLVTNGGNHAMLAGNGMRNPPPPPWLRIERPTELNQDGGGFGSRSQGRRGNGPAMIGTGRIAAGDSAQQIANRPFEGSHLAAVMAVGSAWLDAVLRDDPVAREWLARDARRWLGDAGQIELK